MPAKGGFKLNREQICAFARKRGGSLLTKKTFGARQKYKWKCAKGHIWSATLNNLISKHSWCPVCAGNSPIGLEKCRSHARKKGGRCLSQKYSRRLKWECAKGHKWVTSGTEIITAGKWCQRCMWIRLGKSKRLLIGDIKKLATSRGGRFLSNDYTSAHRKYRWECANGHNWLATVDKIKGAGQWCPYCSKNIGEECVRICFQKIFKMKFPRVRPNWLISPNGYRLELDGFNQRSRIAFEHQGQQHEKFQKFRHGTNRVFKYQLIRDKFKALACKKRRIRLINIPEVNNLVKLDDLKDVVIAKCSRAGIRTPRGAKDLSIDYALAYTPNDRSKEYLERLHQVAKEFQGKCFARKWLGWRSPYDFECKLGHKWRAFPAHVIHSKTWCGKCRGRRAWITRKKHTWTANPRKWIKLLRKVAFRNKGQCLFTRWAGWATPYSFKCSLGHQWKARASNVIHNRAWCKRCGAKQTWKTRRKKAKHRSPSPT